MVADYLTTSGCYPPSYLVANTIQDVSRPIVGISCQGRLSPQRPWSKVPPNPVPSLHPTLPPPPLPTPLAVSLGRIRHGGLKWGSGGFSPGKIF